MTVAVYCRVSTNKNDQLNSLENQRTYFEHAAEEKGYTIYEIYADQGITGTKLRRPEFERMLKDAGLDIITVSASDRDKRKKTQHTYYIASDRTPKFNLILVKNTSRFARNILSMEIISRLKEKSVGIYFMEQNINTLEESQMTILQILQALDESESRDKSIKVRTGIREGARKGTVKTNGRIYGYTYHKDGNRLEINPEEAEVIRTIFELYAKGQGIRRIGEYLTSQGIKTRQGKVFCKSTIQRILANEKYAGLNNPLKYDTGKVFEKYSYPHVKTDYEIKPHERIPEIIAPELFNKCRKILEGKVNHQIQKGIYKGVSKYHGLIYCGNCGEVYHSNNDRGRAFYVCRNKKQHGTAKCNNPNVTERIIDAYIDTLAKGKLKATIQAQAELTTKAALYIIHKKFQEIDEDKTAEAQRLQREIEESGKRLEGYYRLIVSGGASDIIQKLTAEEEASRKEKQERLAIAARGNKEIEREIVEVWKLYEKAAQILLHAKDTYTPKEVLKKVRKIIVHRQDEGFSLEAIIETTEESRILIRKYHMETNHRELTQEEQQETFTKLEKLLTFE